ncbi:MAG: RNA-directed DNA polymerase [Opitutae bacterium]|nr:RNA-directed DNA polymerase [Opitutae bacterium]
MPFSPKFISLSDLYIAYRKAKWEAYHDSNCCHGKKFADYECNLVRNLQHLLKQLLRPEPVWPQSIGFLGKATCIAKSITPSEQPKEHFYDGEPLKGWKRLHKDKKAESDFRPVIDATVDFQIIAVLWALKVGHLYDACLDSKIALGNRLYRRRPKLSLPGAVGEVNADRPELFQAYFRAYARWRNEGFEVMKGELEADRPVLGVTMDLKQFYHRIDAGFLIDQRFLEKMKLSLSTDERRFTRQLLKAIATWNREASRRFGGEATGVPVGLTASSIIANALLKEFDDEVALKLKALHYGRYVDDVFLVLRDTGRFENKRVFMEWLGQKLKRIATYTHEGKDSPSLQLNLAYAKTSALSFVGSKQKIFRLSGKPGLDLIGPIEDQIKRQSSEYRGMPILPRTEAQMAARALLVTPDASLEADSLRKADAVILRRAGFARLLNAVEKHAQDLDAGEWQLLRRNFYGLVKRQVLTPIGFFNYARYLPRIFALMSGCDDIKAAIVLVRKLARVVKVLEQTCEEEKSDALHECAQTLALRLVESILTTRTKDRKRAGVVPLLREIRQRLAPELKIPRSEKRVRFAGERLFLADWAKRPYGTAWLETRVRHRQVQPVPGRSIAELLRIPAIRKLQQMAGIKEEPHWPGLCFPTRSVSLPTLTAHVPRLLEDYQALREISLALRGSWMPLFSELRRSQPNNGRPALVNVPAPSRKQTFIAVTSIRTEDSSWEAAVRGRPELTLKRYQRMNLLINNILQQPTRPSYVILPECSLPRRWARSLANKLSINGISLIAGLEYREVAGMLRNEALVSLVTNFGGYPINISLLQAKVDPAWEEQAQLAKLARKLAPPQEGEPHVPVYRHGSLNFGVLICSDLTNLEHRHLLQGQIDCLFVPEWNRDVNTFGSLVEASSHDLHAFIAQANNLRFGDSRIRGPHKASYMRDVVRVRGGADDYSVTGQIAVPELRAYQSTSEPLLGDDAPFKPYPVGYKIATDRRVSP